MKIFRARPWLFNTLALIVLSVLGLFGVHKNPFVDVLFWIALVLAVVSGVRSELRYRRTHREQQQ